MTTSAITADENNARHGHTCTREHQRNRAGQGTLRIIQQSNARLVLSPFLLSEVGRALSYPRLQRLYHLSEEDIVDHVRHLESLADVVAPAQGPPIVLKDPDDDPVVYTAVAGQADIICTVDRHFYDPNVLAFCARQRILLMTDVELLHALRSQE